MSVDLPELVRLFLACEEAETEARIEYERETREWSSMDSRAVVDLRLSEWCAAVADLHKARAALKAAVSL